MDNKRNTKIIQKKQWLYKKFVKNRTPENETRYRECKNLIETIKRKSKIYYYSEQIMKYKDNRKKTWKITKQMIGKTKMINCNLTEKLIANGKNILNKKQIADEFNNFFVKIGSKLAEKIQPSKYSFESYIDSINTKLPFKTSKYKYYLASTLPLQKKLIFLPLIKVFVYRSTRPKVFC